MFSVNGSPRVHPAVIFDREGNYLSHWGSGVAEFAPAILIDKQDNVWLVDRDRGQVLKFTSDGKELMTIGTKGFRSETGADNTVFGSNGYKDVVRGGEPFNLPAGIALNDAGEVFIADGYANARVHKFSPTGEHLLSWGGPGTGPGEFNLPNAACLKSQEPGRKSLAERDR